MIASSTFKPRRTTASKRLLAGLVASLLAASVPAGHAHAQSGVERLTNKVDRLQRELNDLQRRVYAGDGGEAEPSSGGTGGQAADASEQMTQAAAVRLQEKLSDLERSVQQLTGRLERVQHDLRQLTQRIDTRAKDVDYRLTQLEQAAGISAPREGQRSDDGERTGARESGPANGPDGQSAQQLQPGQRDGQDGDGARRQRAQSDGTGPNQGSQDQNTQAQGGQDQGGQDQGGQDQGGQGQVSRRAVEKLRGNRENPQDQDGQGQQDGSGEGAGGQQAASVNVELPDGSPKERYDFAFGLLRQADYAKAEQALSKFLDAHPEHELAGNAKYWLGEAFYVRGNYERAAVTFAEGFQTYPESQKAPDNLLKLGMSLAQIDRTEDACGIFAELQSRYPDAKNNILQRAQREQDRLDCGQG